MSESGRTCRKVDRRGPAEDEPFTVKLERGEVVVERDGHRMTLRGGVDEVRRALEAGDDTLVQQLVARKVSRGGYA